MLQNLYRFPRQRNFCRHLTSIFSPPTVKVEARSSTPG
jgi:hypothetical protein